MVSKSRKEASQMNVIVVDDDVALLRSLAIVLTSRGHTVKSFDDSREASCFIEHSQPAPSPARCGAGADKPVDVLIVDYIMPGLTGEELLRRTRERLPQTCKVILISGHTDLIEPLNLEAMRVSAFLPKPLDFDKLFELVAER
jgi:DNA-binding NtrC family response regulator